MFMLVNNVGLRIQWGQPRAGSTPAARTKKDKGFSQCAESLFDAKILFDGHFDG